MEKKIKKEKNTKTIKSKLTFDLNDEFEREEFEMMLKAGSLHAALWDISQEIFRPARKHGYSDRELQGLLDERTEDFVGKLEDMFYEILEKHNIKLY